MRTRTILVNVVSLVLLIGAAVWFFVPGQPRLATERSGDEALLGAIGSPRGHHALSVAVVEPGAAEPVRFANLGASETTRYEAGSLTKAMTGLALADAVRRGEIGLDDPVQQFLDLEGSAAGGVTVRDLATHHSGLPRLGGRTARGGWWAGVSGANPYRANLPELIEETRRASTDGGGTYEYSNLGAALAGQSVASASGLSYQDLMRQRVFEPLEMGDTVIADRALVEPGRNAQGRRSDPWVMDAYAPAGGAVTTSADLAKLCTAVLAGRAPGQTALEPLAERGEPGDRIGMFWLTSTVGDDQREVVWHNGRTGGYSAFVGFDLKRGRAVVVLSDVSKNVDELALALLASG